jgi:hypothetical protein
MIRISSGLLIFHLTARISYPLSDPLFNFTLYTLYHGISLAIVLIIISSEIIPFSALLAAFINLFTSGPRVGSSHISIINALFFIFVLLID